MLFASFVRDSIPCVHLTAFPSDAKLVAQFKQGNESAFRALVEQHSGRVYRTALSLLRSSEEAEDVVQEVFVEVYQTVGRFREETSLSSWLYRLASSRALKNREKGPGQETLCLSDQFVWRQQRGAAPPPRDDRRLQALLESQQDLQQVVDAIARLLDAQLVAFTLRHE